jgi:hypothetical protein
VGGTDMSKVFAWSAGGVAVVLAAVCGVLALPESVAGQARPWSGTVPSSEVEAAWARCAELVDARETFVLGPARLREDGQLIVTAISRTAFVRCSVDESGVATGSSITDGSFRDQPFAIGLGTGYLDRPGTTMVGYAGEDVAAARFRAPDGLVIPARVEAGVFLVELPGTRGADYHDLTHEAFDATGALIPGR